MIRHPFLILFLLILFALSSCKTGKQSVNNEHDTEFYINAALLIDGKRMMLNGDYDEAESYFQKAIKDNPQNAAAHYELSQLFLIKKQYEEANQQMEKVVKINPDNEWYQKQYAITLERTGDKKGAANVYESLIKNHPEKQDYYIDLALFYDFNSMYDKAIGVYNKLEEKIGIMPELSLEKERLYVKTGKFKDAQNEVEKLIKAYPKEVNYYGVLAELYLMQGMKEKAFEAFQTIIKLDPSNGEVHLALAEYYNEQGDKDKSFEELKIAFSKPELNIDSKINILLKYLSLTQRFPELKGQSEILMDTLLFVHPEEPKAWSIYADFLNRDNKLIEARDAFIKVIELDSSKYLVWEQLLIVETQLKNYNNVINEGTRAIELFPEQPLLYLYTGGAYISKKKYEKAVEILENGEFFIGKNDKLKVSFNTYLGDAYFQVEKYKSSGKAYEEVLKIEAENTYVLNNYSYYLSLRGENLEKAEKMAEKANMIAVNNATYQDTYAWVLYKSGNYQEAKKWIEKAISNGGNKNPEVLEHYGDILYKLGDKESALAQWKKAKELGEGSEYLDKKIEEGNLYE